MSFQIKGIIKALAAKGAQVSLGITVALHVPVEEPLQAKVFSIINYYVGSIYIFPV